MNSFFIRLYNYEQPFYFVVKLWTYEKTCILKTVQKSSYILNDKYSLYTILFYEKIQKIIQLETS